MNWYKSASHPLAEKLTNQWSSILFKKLLGDFYWTREKSKEKGSDVDPNYFYTGFVPQKNPFNVTHISAKMEVENRKDVLIQATTNVNKGRTGHPTLMDEYAENTIHLMIDIPRNFSENNFSELSYKIKEVLRHEVEHTTPSQSSRLEDTLSLVTDNESEMGLRRRLGYYLNPIEIEAFVTGLYYRAKKSRQQFIPMLDTYINTIKNNIYTIYKKERPYTLIENVFMEIRKKWLDYALKRYPNLKQNAVTSFGE